MSAAVAQIETAILCVHDRSLLSAIFVSSGRRMVPFAEICRETAKAIGCEHTRFHFYGWRVLRLAEYYSPVLCSHAAKQRGAIGCGTET